ncbi:Metallophosphoesterase 1 [Trichinella pseudospiralis]|uniref:Metallophosphoesterase 1 n=2 Tax=Trichinella pseudospiralis TaxID=6337 RepID=A0A0V1E4H4_TRIPS|nr:Metallophosphoesterase 1 [Trichinella pseudospiralis]KRZ25877.1 Metallophosphoesterase 1 [Trichinella pseudospiralis]
MLFIATPIQFTVYDVQTVALNDLSLIELLYNASVKKYSCTMLFSKLQFKYCLLSCVILSAVTILLCEHFIFEIVLSSCSWPDSQNENALKFFVLADTHILGDYKGHWFDKLRREWQMKKCFQTSVRFFNPDAVFVLGDLFDEGMWSDEKRFKKYTNEFYDIFFANSTPLYAVIGNHDVGFHDQLHPLRLIWFYDAFGMDIVELVVLKRYPFILVNSMAMENDECIFCSEAVRMIHSLNLTLQCAKDGRKGNCYSGNVTDYIKPIVMQHFPMFRESDALCDEVDEAPFDQKHRLMLEGKDCLSNKSTRFLLEILQPRAVFSGHTHHGCKTLHNDGEVPEWTVSSYSWRNKNNPAFLMVTVTDKDVLVNKCQLPRESTVIIFYLMLFTFIIISLISSLTVNMHPFRRKIGTFNHSVNGRRISKEEIWLKLSNIRIESVADEVVWHRQAAIGYGPGGGVEATKCTEIGVGLKIGGLFKLAPT